MLDNQLIVLIIQALNAGAITAGLTDLVVAQAAQPTQQGVSSKPTAYLQKIGDRRFGWVKRENYWDEDAEIMRYGETQQYETTFQLSALAIQNPKTPNQYTASDRLNLMAYILQSATTISMFEAQGVGILRIGNIRNPYFLDDKWKYEASPSFDFVVTHKQIITSQVPIISDTEFNIKRV